MRSNKRLHCVLCDIINMQRNSIEKLETLRAVCFQSFHLAEQGKLIVGRVFLRLCEREPHTPWKYLYEEAGDLTGESARTVERVVAELAATSAAAPPRARAGRPPKLGEDKRLLMLDLVRDYLQQGLPVSVDRLRKDLAAHDGPEVRRDLLWRALTRWGFKFGIPRKQSAMLSQEWVKAARIAQVRQRHENRDAQGFPILPEVYIDESFCRLYHTSERTWYHPEYAPYRSTPVGRGQLVVIIGAAVVWQEGGELRGDWVENSFQCWPNSSGTDMAYFPSPSASSATAVPSAVRLEGNMTAEIFEEWFDIVCRHMQSRFGQCIVFLDNARYHKRCPDAAPAKSKTKTEMLAWLNQHYYTGSVLDNWTKDELYNELIAPLRKEKPKTIAEQIAAQHGHSVVFNAAYSPDIMLIETLWAVIKNAIAKEKFSSLSALVQRLRELHATAITSGTIVQAFKSMVSHEAKIGAGSDTAASAAEEEEIEDGEPFTEVDVLELEQGE